MTMVAQTTARGVALVFVLAAVSAMSAPARPNVLYLISDDMRADVHAITDSPTITPNLDALAQRSLIFERAYCQISVCSPSRMSFLNSRRPDTHKVWNFIDYVPQNVTALPRHFRDHGYLALGLGKGFHEDFGMWNAENNWSPPTIDYGYYPYVPASCPTQAPPGQPQGGHCAVPDEAVYDWHLMNHTVRYLRHAARVRRATGQPFFLLSGFKKPHAPWNVPQRMYDLYPDTRAIAPAAHDTLPAGTPLIAWSDQLTVMLANGTEFPYGPRRPVPRYAAQDTRRAYYAAVSYVDENVGKILDALEAEGMANDTIVVFHADHGYSLGEHGEWEKKSNWDLAVRVPLLVHVPWAPPAARGARTAQIAELVDVFPTVAALAGLPPSAGTEGTDLSPLFRGGAVDKAAAYAQYPACFAPGAPAGFDRARLNCNNVPKEDFYAMGYSVRVDSYRFTRWLRWNGTALGVNWDDGDRAGAHADELYSHAGDAGFGPGNFDAFENKNLAQDPAHAAVAARLAAQLRAFFEKR